MPFLNVVLMHHADEGDLAVTVRDQVPHRLPHTLLVVGLNGGTHHAVQLLADQHERLAGLPNRIEVRGSRRVGHDDAASEVTPGGGVRMRRSVRTLGVHDARIGGLDRDQPRASLGGRVRDTPDDAAEVEPADERRQHADRWRGIHASPIGRPDRVLSAN